MPCPICHAGPFIIKERPAVCTQKGAGLERKNRSFHCNRRGGNMPNLSSPLDPLTVMQNSNIIFRECARFSIVHTCLTAALHLGVLRLFEFDTPRQIKGLGCLAAQKNDKRIMTSSVPQSNLYFHPQTWTSFNLAPKYFIIQCSNESIHHCCSGLLILT